MNTARVRITGEQSQQTQRRVVVTGKVRPGIKVLTQAAAKLPKVQETYDAGISAGLSFEEIELNISRLQNAPRYPMTPRNVPYFRVLDGDFRTPNAAKTIMDLYADDRGEGRQLYSFPVVFHSDDQDSVFSEKFECWQGAELLHWSEDGQCMQRQKVTPQANRRQWGGRPVGIRCECRPNSCDLFASGKCHHVGNLYFWIPGVTGVGLIELGFTSIYASLGIPETLGFVRTVLGRINGTHNGKPIFRVSKSLESVSQVDWETGKQTRKNQYIITLDAPGLDMMEVMAAMERTATPPLMVLEAMEPEEVPPATEELPADEPQQAAPQPPAEPEVSDRRAEIKALRKRLGEVMKAYNPPMTGEQLESWLATNDMPKEAVHDPDVLPAIIDVLNRERIDAELAAVDTDGGQEPF